MVEQELSHIEKDVPSEREYTGSVSQKRVAVSEKGFLARMKEYFLLN